MSDTRNVRFKGQSLGRLSVDDLYRMATGGEIDHTAEFWSPRRKTWLPLAGLILDFETSRLADIKDAGIKRVKILGHGEDVCPACNAIEGQVYPIDNVPTLPPAGCACVPWCRLCEIATQ